MKEVKKENMTNSQAKRAARKAEAERAKKAALRDKIIGYLIMIVIVASICAIAVVAIIKSANKVVASDNYSACLDDNGYIKNTGAADIELPDYKNIVVPLSEVEYTDEEVEENISSVLESNKALSDEAGIVVKDGDEVNIDYVGKVDGEEFDGGSAEGYDLVIGSNSFIPGFESQIIGKEVASTFDIDVTFPEGYSDELGGKDAVFTVTVNGVYVVPEFTDEFVAENLSEYASTVDEYKQYLKDTNYATNLRNWIENYIDDNSVVNRFDKKYVKNLKSTIKNDDMMNFEYTQQMYEQILGYSYYNSFSDYIGMTEADYDLSLDEKAKDSYKNNLAYQSIIELEQASVDDTYYKNILADQGGDEQSFDTLVEEYGRPFVYQMAIKEKALDVITDMVTVE